MSLGDAGSYNPLPRPRLDPGRAVAVVADHGGYSVGMSPFGRDRCRCGRCAQFGREPSETVDDPVADEQKCGHHDDHTDKSWMMKGIVELVGDDVHDPSRAKE